MVWCPGKNVSWILQNLKLKNRCLFWAHNPGSLIVYVFFIKHRSIYKKTYVDVHCGPSHNIKKKKKNWNQTKYLPTWRDKPSVVYSHNGMLLSCSIVSGSLWPHRLQQARLSCPSLSPGVCSNSCLLSWWWYLTVLSSASPFSFCLQSFPASGSFPMSWFFASSGQCIGASALASVLPMNIQSWFSLELTESPRDFQESSPAPQFKSIFSSVLSLLYGPALTSFYGYWKSHSFDYMELCQKSDVFAFNMLPMFVIVFLPRSRCFCLFVCLFVCLFNFMASATISSGFVSQENKIWYCFHFLSWSLGLDAMILVFWMLF